MQINGCHRHWRYLVPYYLHTSHYLVLYLAIVPLEGCRCYRKYIVSVVSLWSSEQTTFTQYETDAHQMSYRPKHVFGGTLRQRQTCRPPLCTLQIKMNPEYTWSVIIIVKLRINTHFLRKKSMQLKFVKHVISSSKESTKNT